MVIIRILSELWRIPLSIEKTEEVDIRSQKGTGQFFQDHLSVQLSVEDIYGKYGFDNTSTPYFV